METILELVFELRLNMQLGLSLEKSLESILAQREDSYSKSLAVVLKKIRAGQSLETVLKIHKEVAVTPARRSLLTVIQRGLGGSSIDSHLQELEKEFYYMLESSFQKKLQLLPFKLLIPLAFFVLPAVLLLITGSLFFSLTTQM